MDNYIVRKKTEELEVREYPAQSRSIVYRYETFNKTLSESLFLHFPKCLFCRESLADDVSPFYFWAFLHDDKVCTPFLPRSKKRLNLIKKKARNKKDDFLNFSAIVNWRYFTTFPNILDRDVGEVCIGDQDLTFDEFVDYFWRSEFNDSVQDGVDLETLRGLRILQRSKKNVFELLHSTQWPKMLSFDGYLNRIERYAL